MDDMISFSFLRTFESAKAVNVHVIKEHVIQLPSQGLCPWDTCDGLRRGKWSLLTHVQVWFWGVPVRLVCL